MEPRTVPDFEPGAPAADAAEVRARHDANRAAWNEGAARYTEEIEETIAFLRSGGSNLHPVERANLGDLAAWCRMAIHLQCASGRDTLSLWNEGVSQVVGVDISDVHIANARRISAALAAPATWYRCDVLDTPHELDGTADLVYTGRGALCWLHDLNGWAAVIARLLKPGGLFHVFDDHPVNWLFEQDTEDLVADALRLLHPQRLVTGVAVDLHRRPGRAGRAAGAQVRAPLAVVRHLRRVTRGGPHHRALRRASRGVLGRLPQAEAGAKGDHPDDLLDGRVAAGAV